MKYSCLLCVVAVIAAIALVHPGTASEIPAICGNGILEGNEECDDGEDNSDSIPNSCRSNCRRYHCGDGVTDRGEACDNGFRNSDQIPDACRTNCKKPHCGDGVRDGVEECDDANSDDYDGCYRCRACYKPKDDLEIKNEAKLCPGTYTLRDKNRDGIIKVTGSDLRLDCRRVRLIGSEGFKMMLPKSKGSKSSSGGTRKKAGGSTTPQESRKRLRAQRQGMATGNWKGTGIAISGKNVVLHGGRIRHFKHGILLRGSNAVLYHNRACNNSIDIKDEGNGNHGVKNMCRNYENWQENGRDGCSAPCP